MRLHEVIASSYFFLARSKYNVVLVACIRCQESVCRRQRRKFKVFSLVFTQLIRDQTGPVLSFDIWQGSAEENKPHIKEIIHLWVDVLNLSLKNACCFKKSTFLDSTWPTLPWKCQHLFMSISQILQGVGEGCFFQSTGCIWAKVVLICQLVWLPFVNHKHAQWIWRLNMH